MNHNDIWAAIDSVAHMMDMSSSGLAKFCGLDATTFNKSKRIGNNGKERWPSTHVLSKILAATGIGIDEFAQILIRVRNTGTVK